MQEATVVTVLLTPAETQCKTRYDYTKHTLHSFLCNHDKCEVLVCGSERCWWEDTDLASPVSFTHCYIGRTGFKWTYSWLHAGLARSYCWLSAGGWYWCIECGANMQRMLCHSRCFFCCYSLFLLAGYYYSLSAAGVFVVVTTGGFHLIYTIILYLVKNNS